MLYTILVVEDDADINNLLAKMLRQADYQVTQVYSGSEAALRLEHESPDLILLDLMLPGMSGEALLEKLRGELGCDAPVIILSAKTAVGDKVGLLKLGADDYITKPFEPEEVLARIEAALRRVGKEATNDKPLTHRALTLSPSLRKATLAGQELALTAHEFDILELLMRQPEKVYTRESLYEQVWHGGYYGENNTVNVHVSNIRKKLKAIDPDADYIQTVYGIGFKLQ
ncbi:MAG: response regulator transcription factor [Peptococcaceae bacterium]|nr:response regulator transcription factor [Peptococcaceae bacterium]